MANTTNLDLVPLDGSNNLKNFPTPYNENLDKIDTFAGTVDSDMASIWGKIPWAGKVNLIDTDDVNNCTDITKLYIISLNKNPANAPTSSGGYTVYCISTNWGYMQFAVPYNDGAIKYRIKFNNAWSPWRSISYT